MLIHDIETSKLTRLAVHLVNISTINDELSPETHLGSHKIYGMISRDFPYNLRLDMSFKKLSETITYPLEGLKDIRMLVVTLRATNVFNRGEIYEFTEYAAFPEDEDYPKFTQEYVVKEPSSPATRMIAVRELTDIGKFCNLSGIPEKNIETFRLVWYMMNVVLRALDKRFKE